MNKVKIVSKIINNLNPGERLVLASDLFKQEQSTEAGYHRIHFLYICPQCNKRDGFVSNKEFILKNNDCNTDIILLKGIELSHFIETELNDMNSDVVDMLLSYFDSSSYIYKDEVLDYIFSNLHKIIIKEDIISYVSSLKKEVLLTKKDSNEFKILNKKIVSILQLIYYCDKIRLDTDHNDSFKLDWAVAHCDKVCDYLKSSQRWDSNSLASKVALPDIYNFFEKN